MSDEIDIKFTEYAHLIDAELDTVHGTLVTHKRFPGSRDLVISIPGGHGQSCFSDQVIRHESLIIPTNLMSLFHGKNISSCVFNSSTRLPLKYIPLMPLYDDDHDDQLVKQHYQQIKAIVEHYSKSYDRIWMLGHSSSAASLVGMMKWWPQLEDHISGLILLAPKKIFKHARKKYVPHFGKVLSIPILAVNHVLDGARNCPADFNRALSKCSKNRCSNHVMLSGGIPDGDNDPSLGFGYHGFRGIENELVEEIVKFINSVEVDQ